MVVGCRLHHRAGVHRHRPQGQGSPLCPQWAAAWPLVPRSGTPSSARTSEPSDFFDPSVTQMYHIFTQPAERNELRVDLCYQISVPVRLLCMCGPVSEQQMGRSRGSYAAFSRAIPTNTPTHRGSLAELAKSSMFHVSGSRSRYVGCGGTL